MMLKQWPWLVFALALLCAAPAVADNPFSRLVLFKRLEANPNEMYPLSEENGPWTILAATFTGEGAEQQAQELIYELRSEFKLPAYSYRKKFDFSKPVKGKGLTEFSPTPTMRYSKGDVIEYAVLVGDYPSVDDPEAQKVLRKLKYAQPKSLSVKPGEKNNLALADVRAIQRKELSAKLPKTAAELQRGPMGNSFIMTNPLLPKEYFVPKGVDKLVLDMNKGVTHSLLDCPYAYSVKVATFGGHAILLDKKAANAIRNGQEPKSWLEDAAKNAHLLTEALRKEGYEAYEFHDRTSSIVTVGGFDAVGTMRPDGTFAITNPAVMQIVKTFGAEVPVGPSSASQGVRPKTLVDVSKSKIKSGKKGPNGKPTKLADLPFDPQPVPYEVPRRSISNSFSRSAQLR